MIADLFSLVGMVALDQRAFSDQGASKKQGFHYSAYANKGTAAIDSMSLLMAKKQAGGPKSASNAPGSREEKIVFKETEEEYKRRGLFKRLFPSPDFGYYK